MVCVYVKENQAFNVVIVVLLMLLFIKHLSTCLVSCVKFRTAFNCILKLCCYCKCEGLNNLLDLKIVETTLKIHTSVITPKR